MPIMLPLLLTTLALLTTSFFIFSLLYDTVSCYLLTPRRIKQKMAKQGVHGPKPRPLLGNILDVASLLSKSTSSDMPSISHDLVPRLLPHFLAWSSQFGKRFIFWNGIEPRMCLTETDLIKELLSKYSTVSGKSWLQQQGSKHFIGRGYMVECTKEMLESIEKEVKSGRSEFEIGEYMTRLTADIISRTEFESSFEKGKQIFHLLTVLQHLCAQASRHLCFPGSR
ncbi:cytokinin hydroxylase-like [Cucumis melo var. makuwa]|uniref:Cytokinin hydroxylase-like n=1 Tax=Cucumis melo var. makuwa TaxID=1194695 RepID=A0A5D3BMX1_CUCMM|nr:cytokinin hydroxylase-like [Cucumis melo var. makuwa]